MYNNSMHYDLERENEEIKKVYNRLKIDKNIKLYIAYFQPYMKLINPYARVQKMRSLNEKVKIQEKEMSEMDKKIKIQQKDLDEQKEKISKQEKELNEYKEEQKNWQKNFELKMKQLEDKKNEEIQELIKMFDKMIKSDKINSENSPEKKKNYKKTNVNEKNEKGSNDKVKKK